jgi:hypothetical protein
LAAVTRRWSLMRMLSEPVPVPTPPLSLASPLPSMLTEGERGGVSPVEEEPEV